MFTVRFTLSYPLPDGGHENKYLEFLIDGKFGDAVHYAIKVTEQTKAPTTITAREGSVTLAVTYFEGNDTVVRVWSN